MMIKRIIFLVYFMLLSVILFSAELLVVSGAKGSSFTIIRDGKTYPFDLSKDEVKGMTLYRGDTIITAKDTFIEIELIKGDSSLVIAGDSTVILEQIDRDGGGVFRLGYGRIRAKVKRLSPRAEFFLIAETTAVGVQGMSADFGFDYIYSVNREKTATVYSFKGDLTVARFPQSSELEARKWAKPESSLPVDAGEMVILSDKYEQEETIKMVVSQEITDFWNYTTFDKDNQIARNPDNELMEYTGETAGWKIPAIDSKRAQMKMAGAYTFGIGAGIISLGLFSALLSPAESRTAGYIFAGFGGGLSLVGTGFIIGSYMYPASDGPLLDQ